ncbi:chondroadherin [Latimeria chalumnae]|uniref:chondroadherin n=1 Tax=Latimeria chalumnae TaxID=7897 RepID=UPI0003C157E2|nr:PREDICTED: chondroadherin [Latimeria chalumnae]|eukprot:XP_005999661.1 PREDICTED: chondroadherin [Latimeria chalumnae]
MLRISFFLLTLVTSALSGPCPQSCHCHGDLQHVICDNVGLKRIPKVTEQTKLLNLQRNHLPVLPSNGFSSMKGLVSLHLQYCHIKEVSSQAFKGLKKLVYLYLSNNEISIIKSSAFEDLTELTYLYMDNNKIIDIPKGLLSPLINLFILQLSMNSIRELRPGVFSGAKDLRWLHLTSNEINTIHPGSLDDIENLAVFHLDNNQLTTYPSAAMSKLRVVEELKLSQNPMKVIPDNAFQSFGRYVEKIFLDAMGLEKLSDGAFNGVTALKSLHIENNKLTTLPSNLVFTSLQNMTLHGNPWQCNCNLAHLRRWMDSNRLRPAAVCASPSRYRGQQVRDTAAFSGCRLKIRRAKKRGLFPSRQ